ncbi:DICT sensory domain-containing protein [Halorubrum cibi]|uniref:Diguanylate Cyclase and Two-component system sensory domain-containing protein n=1 Tax=Halorubrum cibi TaxID=413815 RepID=A0A521BBT5_9EURY|nr:DICT sensory domain-containing protein [Halorubrum cibi]SMO44552.1 Diguanylate Cyclase and Two-component system sensory domain-containing protein [Halorubrum cibi]
MSLIEIISGVEAREATLTVFDRDPSVAETLAEHFADRNLRVVAERPAEGPTGYAVLSRGGEFVTAVSVDEVLPGSAGGDADGPPGEADRAPSRRVGEPVLDHLDETLFTSYSRSDMVAASREIEDRAWRVGDGELHAGFQTLDVLTGESNTYDRLGGKERLEVHAYAAAEGEAPNTDRYEVHIGRTAEIRETWFVAYDGGGFDGAKCVLLAEEREPDRFYGFWSYDPDTVDRVIDYLTERYGTSERQGEDDATA